MYAKLGKYYKKSEFPNYFFSQQKGTKRPYNEQRQLFYAKVVTGTVPEDTRRVFHKISKVMTDSKQKKEKDSPDVEYR
jgi:hypothetical protein